MESATETERQRQCAEVAIKLKRKVKMQKRDIYAYNGKFLDTFGNGLDPITNNIILSNQTETITLRICSFNFLF